MKRNVSSSVTRARLLEQEESKYKTKKETEERKIKHLAASTVGVKLVIYFILQRPFIKNFSARISLQA